VERRLGATGWRLSWLRDPEFATHRYAGAESAAATVRLSPERAAFMSSVEAVFDDLMCARISPPTPSLPSPTTSWCNSFSSADPVTPT
jgi:hypothetical protein